MAGFMCFLAWSYFVVSYGDSLSFSILGQEVNWSTTDAIVAGAIVLGVFLAVQLSTWLGDIFRLRRQLSRIERG
mgnify:CR=1 FL=1